MPDCNYGSVSLGLLEIDYIVSLNRLEYFSQSAVAEKLVDS